MYKVYDPEIVLAAVGRAHPHYKVDLDYVRGFNAGLDYFAKILAENSREVKVRYADRKG